MFPFSISKDRKVFDTSKRLPGYVVNMQLKQMKQVLNAAASLMVSGHVGTLAEAVALARETHQSGKALDTLDRWVAVSNLSANYASFSV